MLRVGLTGSIGSGKSTVAAIFREQGIAVIEADEIARHLMEPGQCVYRAIVEHFGPTVLLPEGKLNRAQLAQLAFQGGRLKELNALVHPPVIAAEQAWAEELFRTDKHAIAMVESALIFEASLEQASVPGWRDRFDRLLLVTAPDAVKIARYVERVRAQEPEASAVRIERIRQDACSRLAAQIPDEQKIPFCSAVINNSGDLAETRLQVLEVTQELRQAAARKTR